MKEKFLRYLGMNKLSFTVFLTVTFSTSIYWWGSIRGVLYEPFREALGVSNTQLGFLLGLVGFVQIFGYVLLGWLQDLIPIRKMIAIDMVGYGIFALIASLVPDLPFWYLVITFIAFGLFGDAIYWPTVQKATRGTASDATQAASFSTQEAIRSVNGLIINSLTLGLFFIGGSSVFGVRLAMTFYSVFMILYSLVVLKLIPNDFLQSTILQKKEKTNKKEALLMLAKAAKLPIVWTTGFGAAGGYLVFVAANTYFLPIIQSTFGLSSGVMGFFGILNIGVMAIIASPLSGMMASWKFKSSAQWMAVVFAVIGLLCVLMLVIPRGDGYMFVVIGVALLISLCCYAVRAVYYAPIGEYGVSRGISATAMSLASAIGYSPAFFGYLIFGALLDNYSTEDAYSRMFIIMGVFCLVSVLVNILGAYLIKRNGGRSTVTTEQDRSTTAGVGTGTEVDPLVDVVD
ncbi:MFS transporter [Actinomyces minihominis]|uniref:MFS transporter n=1 Tax=Actinomyces minihominis TaxID=2002838 RepID=UPI000C077DC3|nr:MFS transporter [Actinomyces minihominis]